MTDFAAILQLVKSLYFHISEAGKWCPFRARPHRIGNCRESPPGSVSVSEQTFHQLSRLSVTFRQREATAGARRILSHLAVLCFFLEKK